MPKGKRQKKLGDDLVSLASLLPRKSEGRFRVSSPRQMQSLANLLAREVLSSARQLRRSSRNPDRSAPGSPFILALSGNLGSGKTIFTQGFLRGLGVRGKITSPTFILMQRFPIPTFGINRPMRFRNAFHIDCYRLKNINDFKILDLEKIFRDPQNIIVIEWAEKIKKLLPKNSLWIDFKYGEKSNERKISFSTK